MELQIIDIGFEMPNKPVVLVTDDEPALQTLVYDTLCDDYRIVAAFNGREGVTKAAHVHPDLILMDMMMPDLGGYEAVRLLQDNPETKNIPVIILTAQDFDPSTIQMLKSEPNVAAFLNKPFRPKALREAVKNSIKK